ncbi:MAG: molybdopterin molybdotransferase MoeA [Candidatus Limnocylindrus sp.]
MGGRLSLVRADELLALLVRQAGALPAERVSASAAGWLDLVGRTLAAPVHADLDLPPVDVSAMDGWAVRSSDLERVTRESPLALEVDGDAAAGRTRGLDALAAGTCRRIATGAAIPLGADAVVPVEETALSGVHREATLLHRVPSELPKVVWFFEAVQSGRSIRRQGEDTRAGAELLPTGSIMDAAGVTVLIGSGAKEVILRPRPRVAIVTSGSELNAFIPDTNGPMLAALITEAGGEVVTLRSVADDRATTSSVIAAASTTCDLLVTTGGVSVGAHDHVGEVLAEHFETVIWRLAIQPGKPLLVGARRSGSTGAQWAFGLPGNPVSAYVTALEFVLPLLRILAGRPPLTLATRGRLLEAVSSPLGRRSYLRLAADRDGNGAPRLTPDGCVAVRLAGPQGSHQAHVLAGTDFLGLIPEEVLGLDVGAEIELHPLPRAMRRI